jgi:hypothetical protein
MPKLFNRGWGIVMERPEVLIVDGAPASHCDPEHAKPARDWAQTMLDSIEGINQDEVATKILALQTALQAGRFGSWSLDLDNWFLETSPTCRAPRTAVVPLCSCIRTRRIRVGVSRPACRSPSKY